MREERQKWSNKNNNNNNNEPDKGQDTGDDLEDNPVLARRAVRLPHPQFGSDGLFSLACAEQLEQYSCLEMDGGRVRLSSPEKTFENFPSWETFGTGLLGLQCTSENCFCLQTFLRYFLFLALSNGFKWWKWQFYGCNFQIELPDLFPICCPKVCPCSWTEYSMRLLNLLYIFM